MTPQPLDIKCLSCEFFIVIEQVSEDKPPPFIYKCRAFPNGIPVEIRTWESPHRSVRDDQKGNLPQTNKP